MQLKSLHLPNYKVFKNFEISIPPRPQIFDFKQEKLLMAAGLCGSGKTTLLIALLNTFHQLATKGKVSHGFEIEYTQTRNETNEQIRISNFASGKTGRTRLWVNEAEQPVDESLTEYLPEATIGVCTTGSHHPWEEAWSAKTNDDHSLFIDSKQTTLAVLIALLEAEAGSVAHPAIQVASRLTGISGINQFSILFKDTPESGLEWLTETATDLKRHEEYWLAIYTDPPRTAQRWLGAWGNAANLYRELGKLQPSPSPRMGVMQRKELQLWSELGTGEQKIFVLASLISLFGAGENLLLVDDCDSRLNDAWLRHLIGILQSSTDQCQTIATTNSCIPLSDLPREAILVLERERLLQKAATLLSTQRRTQGAIYGQSVGNSWIDENGKILSKPFHSQMIVSELMITANHLVAGWLAHHNLPAPFRTHAYNAAIDPLILSFLQDLGNQSTLESFIDQAFARAKYEPQVRQHAGLQLNAYCHFTSPIRRFSDLVLHRILRTALLNQPSGYTPEEIVEICGTRNQHRIQQAEQLSEAKKAQAQAKCSRLINQEHALPTLNEKRFSAVVKTAVHDRKLEMIAPEVRQRAKEGRLNETDLYFILIELTEWEELRLQVLAENTSNPRLVSVLLIAASKKQVLTQCELEEGHIQSFENQFPCRFIGIVHNKAITTYSWNLGSSKRESKQQAAVKHPTRKMPNN